MSKLIVLSKRLHAYMDGTFLLLGSLSHQFLINSDMLGEGSGFLVGPILKMVLYYGETGIKNRPLKKEFVIKINYNEPE